MIIKGKIEFISALTKGEDKNGKEYEKAYFTVTDGNGQYPDKYKIDLFNKTESMRGLRVGSDVSVHVNGKVNEYNGNHFGSLNLWKVEVASEEPKKETKSIEPETEENQLPF